MTEILILNSMGVVAVIGLYILFHCQQPAPYRLLVVERQVPLVGAEPVSCVATAITGIAPMPTSSATSGSISPIAAPGITTSCISDFRKPSASNNSSSQSCFIVLYNCDVVANVNSVFFTPVSRYVNRSGMKSRSVATSRSGDPSQAMVSSWNRVLKGRN